MALKASAHCLLVQPTEERRQILVVRDTPDDVQRGVVLHIGRDVTEDVAVGNVVYYSGSYEIEDKRIVPTGNLLAIEDEL